MEDRILSGSVFLVLSASFGGCGLWTLLEAYRTGDPTAWTDKAVRGGLCVMGSFVFAQLLTRLIS
jgi:hypothetical protein